MQDFVTPCIGSFGKYWFCSSCKCWHILLYNTKISHSLTSPQISTEKSWETITLTVTSRKLQRAHKIVPLNSLESWGCKVFSQGSTRPKQVHGSIPPNQEAACCSATQALLGSRKSVCHPLFKARTTLNQHQTWTGGQSKVMAPLNVKTCRNLMVCKDYTP